MTKLYNGEDVICCNFCKKHDFDKEGRDYCGKLKLSFDLYHEPKCPPSFCPLPDKKESCK